MKFPGCYRISPVWDRINQPGYDKTNPEKLGSLELLLTLPYPIGELDPSIVCKPNYPGKRPRTVWGCGRIMYVFFCWLWFPTSLCGVAVFDSVSRLLLLRLLLLLRRLLFVTHHLSHTTLSHTIFHTQLCHTPYLSHTTLSQTIFHTLFHTPSFTHYFVTPSFTHNFVTHNIFFYTHLCQPPSCTHHLFTHNFVTHHLSHTTLSHTISFTHLFHTLFHAPSFTHNLVTHHLLHTTLSHTPSFHTQLCHTPSFTHNFVTHHIFHTQLCHKPSFTHSFTHHLSHTTLSHTIFHTQLCNSPSFTHIFVNHHLSHTIFHNLVTLRDSGTLRGRRSTWRHLPSFRLAGMLQVALGGALGRRWSPSVAGDAAALCMAGVALGDIYLRFAWHACYRLHLVARLVAVGRRWSPLVAVGRRWSPLVAVGRRLRRGTLRGRRGTWRHLSSFYVAGVALGDIYVRFTWQAWHLATSTFVLRGRRATGYIFDTPSFTPLCYTPSFTHHLSHHFVTHTPCFTHRHRPSFTHHLSHTTLSHTIFNTPSFTHHFVTHTHHLSPHHLSHTTSSPTIFFHTIFDTPLCHTPSFGTPSFTHHFVTHHLSHTTLSCALFHIHFHTHHLSHTTLSHTHTIFLCHRPCFIYNFATHNFVFPSFPAPLQHLVLLIGRSCLVGLSGPLSMIMRMMMIMMLWTMMLRMMMSRMMRCRRRMLRMMKLRMMWVRMMMLRRMRMYWW